MVCISNHRINMHIISYTKQKMCWWLCICVCVYGGPGRLEFCSSAKLVVEKGDGQKLLSPTVKVNPPKDNQDYIGHRFMCRIMPFTAQVPQETHTHPHYRPQPSRETSRHPQPWLSNNDLESWSVTRQGDCSKPDWEMDMCWACQTRVCGTQSPPTLYCNQDKNMFLLLLEQRGANGTQCLI